MTLNVLLVLNLFAMAALVGIHFGFLKSWFKKKAKPKHRPMEFVVEGPSMEDIFKMFKPIRKADGDIECDCPFCMIKRHSEAKRQTGPQA
jgi:hypothetical protein